MAEYTALAPLFTDIANAIRSKTGETGQITANSFPNKINSIATGVDLSFFTGKTVLYETSTTKHNYILTSGINANAAAFIYAYRPAGVGLAAVYDFPTTQQYFLFNENNETLGGYFIIKYLSSSDNTKAEYRVDVDNNYLLAVVFVSNS